MNIGGITGCAQPPIFLGPIRVLKHHALSCRSKESSDGTQTTSVLTDHACDRKRSLDFLNRFSFNSQRYEKHNQRNKIEHYDNRKAGDRRRTVSTLLKTVTISGTDQQHQELARNPHPKQQRSISELAMGMLNRTEDKVEETHTIYRQHKHEERNGYRNGKGQQIMDDKASYCI